MNLDHYADLTDSVGAASILARKFGGSYSVEALRQLVKNDRIRCLIFEGGVLTERHPGKNTRGRDVFFLRSDIEALERPRRGRPEKQV